MRCRYPKIDYANRSCCSSRTYNIYSNPGRLLIPHDRLQRVCAARRTPMIFITVYIPTCSTSIVPPGCRLIGTYIKYFSAFFRYNYVYYRLGTYTSYTYFILHVRFFGPTREERKKNKISHLWSQKTPNLIYSNT